jgi:hypothetical protein
MLIVDWILALLAAVMWIGVMVWYFWAEISQWRIKRYDKWLKGD